jgi:hypothetical protein
MHDFVAASGMGEDATWATDLAGKLGNMVEFRVAFDLNVDKDKVIWSKAGSGATVVDMFAMGLTTVFRQESDHFSGKIHMVAIVLDAVKDRSTRMGKTSGRSWPVSIQGKVKREFEFTNMAGTLQRTSVPLMGLQFQVQVAIMEASTQ